MSLERVYLSDTKYIGWCVQDCMSDADCPASTACVNVDCNQAGGCRPACVPTCPDGSCRVGTCRSMPNAADMDSTDACSVKLSDGRTCRSDNDCLSGFCNAFGKCE